MRRLILATVLLLGSNVALAATLTTLAPFCFNKDSLGQFYSAIKEHDNKTLNLLVASEECFVTGAGVQVTVIRKTGKFSKVRAYTDFGNYEIWVASPDVHK